MKFILIGNSNIGKSSLLYKFKNKQFIPYIPSTNGVDMESISYNMLQHNFQIIIWDTCGQENFQKLAPIFYKDIIGIFLCFDFGNRKSFLDIKNWLNMISIHFPKHGKIILVGLKSDLKHKAISLDEAEVFAIKNKFDFYTISSQKDNCDNIFLNTVGDIYNDYLNGKIKSNNSLGGFRVTTRKQTRSCCFGLF